MSRDLRATDVKETRSFLPSGGRGSHRLWRLDGLPDGIGTGKAAMGLLPARDCRLVEEIVGQASNVVLMLLLLLTPSHWRYVRRKIELHGLNKHVSKCH